MSDDNEIEFEPVITERAFPFLRVQQGRIEALADDPAAWREAYRLQLLETLEAIDDFIPRPLTSVLDIGGGMGGFDALLARCQPGLRITIMDGFSDKPVPERDKAFSQKTYSDADAALDFLNANNVPTDDVSFINANAPEAKPTRQFDLILSLQAWCFHFMPAVYMKFALAASRPGTVWILDVRVMTKFWASDLFSQERLEPIGEAPGFNDKYTRMAFRVIA